MGETADQTSASDARPERGPDIRVDDDALDELFASPSIAPQPVRRRRTGRIVPVVAALVVLAGAGAFALSRPSTAPGTWDPRLARLATFVETTRGGTFEHAVPVVFNSDDTYDAHFAIDRDEQDPAEIARSVAHLRALGFVAGEFDLLETSETLYQEGTAGFYDHEDGRIHVKGDPPTTFDRRMQAILVHELTHAYDFQRFDIHREDDEFANSGEEFAYRAVVEGSAQLVEQEYVLTWSDTEQDEYWNGEGNEQDVEAVAALDELPAIFVESLGLPYALGPRFIEALRVAGEGDVGDAIDRALRKLPESEEHVARPETYLRGQKVVDVVATALARGEKTTEEPDDFGQVSLALLLAPHVGGDRAWTAVDGWAGDATTYYGRGGDRTHCVQVDVEFDDPIRAQRFRDEARPWGQALNARIKLDNTRVVLDACDPGPGGPAVKEAEPTVTASLVLRADLLNSWVGEGADVDVAGCVGDHVIETIGTEQFMALDRRLQQDHGDQGAIDELQSAMGEAMPRCQSAGR